MVKCASRDIELRIAAVTELANSIRFDYLSGTEDLFPDRELTLLKSAGLLDAPLPRTYGGCGMGSEAGMHGATLLAMKELGRANLSLGRVYEAHVNAIQLVFAFGSAEQKAEVAEDCFAGKLFAVWNTDSSDPVRLLEEGDSWRLSGAKAFASAARRAERPLVMAERPGVGRQMCLLRKEEVQAEIDPSSWMPLGMHASESYRVDFTGTQIGGTAFVGQPGDYYDAPLFQGGAIRTSAVIFGGAEALFRYVLEYLRHFKQTERPLQQLRVARIYAAILEGRGVLQAAAGAAEAGLYAGVTHADAARMNFAANATRVAVEDLCPQIVRLVSESVGARGLMPPFRFASIIKDMTMFLRQPAPDECLLATGRYLLESGDQDA